MDTEKTILRFHASGRMRAETAQWLIGAFKQELQQHGDRVRANQALLHLLDKAGEQLRRQGEQAGAFELGALASELKRSRPSTTIRAAQALLGGLLGALAAALAVLAFFLVLMLLIELVFGSPIGRVRVPAKALLAVVVAPIAGAILGGLYGWNLDANAARERLRGMLDAAPIFDRAWMAWAVVWTGGTLAAFVFFKPFDRSSVRYWRTDDWLSFAAIWVLPIAAGWVIARLVRWVAAGRLE